MCQQSYLHSVMKHTTCVYLCSLCLHHMKAFSRFQPRQSPMEPCRSLCGQWLFEWFFLFFFCSGLGYLTFSEGVSHFLSILQIISLTVCQPHCCDYITPSNDSLQLSRSCMHSRLLCFKTLHHLPPLDLPCLAKCTSHYLGILAT